MALRVMAVRVMAVPVISAPTPMSATLATDLKYLTFSTDLCVYISMLVLLLHVLALLSGPSAGFFRRVTGVVIEFLRLLVFVVVIQLVITIAHCLYFNSLALGLIIFVVFLGEVILLYAINATLECLILMGMR